MLNFWNCRAAIHSGRKQYLFIYGYIFLIAVAMYNNGRKQYLFIYGYIF